MPAVNKPPSESSSPSKRLRETWATKAVGKGFYHSPGWNKDYPRLQILRMSGETKDQGVLGFN